MKKIEGDQVSSRPVLAAGGITMIGYGLGQFSRLAANLVLTRLLVPEMFGVMALVGTLIAAFTMLSDTGVRQYIYWSKEGISPKVLNAAWTIKIVRGVIISLLMMALAPGLYFFVHFVGVSENSTYAHPMLPYVIAAMAFCPLIAGFESTKKFELNRRLAVGMLAIQNLACQTVGLTLTIFLAWWYQSIWALVAGNILTILMTTISTHVFLPGHRNSFSWDKKQFREIFSFSRWILLSSILGFLAMHSDWLWLGALISAEQLGIYSIGKSLAFFAFALTKRLSNSVVLPELSNVAREDPGNFSKSYYSMRKFIDIPIYFGAGLLYMSGPAIIEFLYDARYIEAGVVLRILSLILLGTGFGLAIECLVALGQVKRRAIITGITAVSLNITIPCFYLLYGFNGVLYAMVISQFVPVVLLIYSMWKNGQLNLLREVIFLPLFVLGLGGGVLFSDLLGRMA